MNESLRSLARAILDEAGLLGPIRAFRRRIGPPPGPNVFHPLGPPLLIAVDRCLRWCLENEVAGDYLEFGIFRGFTLWYAQAIAADLGPSQMQFYGFDSFAGLPPPDGIDVSDEFSAGTFTATRRDVERWLTQFGTDWSKTHLVEGWFQDSLTARTRENLRLERCAVCVIDSDLYSSAQLALNFIAPLIGERALVVFDDWSSFENDPTRGEQRAFAEFLEQNPHVSAQPFLEFKVPGKGLKGFLLEREG